MPVTWLGLIPSETYFSVYLLGGELRAGASLRVQAANPGP
jgi:hypothetical protein